MFDTARGTALPFHPTDPDQLWAVFVDVFIAAVFEQKGPSPSDPTLDEVGDAAQSEGVDWSPPPVPSLGKLGGLQLHQLHAESKDANQAQQCC